MQNTFLLESSVLTGGKDGAVSTTESSSTTANTTAEVQQTTETTSTGTSSYGGFSMFSLIMIYVVVIGAMYYFTIRPAKKREKAIQAKQEEIKVGDEVVTTSGMYGKVVDIGDTTFNVEFGANKSIIIPINKKDVLPVNVKVDEKETKASKAESKDAK